MSTLPLNRRIPRSALFLSPVNSHTRTDFIGIPNLWIIFSHSSNSFGEFYLVNTHSFEHLRQFKVCRNPNQSITDLRKFWRGFCWHSKKTNSQTAFQSVWTMSNLSTFIKDKSQTSWQSISVHLQGTKQWLRPYWFSETDSKTSVAFEET